MVLPTLGAEDQGDADELLKLVETKALLAHILPVCSRSLPAQSVARPLSDALALVPLPKFVTLADIKILPTHTYLAHHKFGKIAEEVSYQAMLWS